MEARDYVDAIRATGLTQVEIEERTGIPQPTISKIERGAVGDVMSKNYRALQQLYEEIVPSDNRALIEKKVQHCQEADQQSEAGPKA